MAKKNTIKRPVASPRAKTPEYPELLGRIAGLLEQARRATVRVANSLLTTTYWEVGRQIVEHEQEGSEKADYGEAIVDRLAADLTKRFGRGFSRRNVFQIRSFFIGWEIVQTTSAQFVARVKCQTVSGKTALGKVQTLSAQLQPASVEHLPFVMSTASPSLFPLPWSLYVRLMSVKEDFARWFYEEEAIAAGWSVRQLDRMISTQHYERTLLSKNKASMLLKKEHMMVAGEHDPVGLILCSDKSDAVVKYAMGGINAKVFASQYLTSLPDAEILRQELLRTKHAFETRAALKGKEDE